MNDISNAPTPPHPLSPEEVRAWLDYQTEALVLRSREIVSALQAMAETHPSIIDGDEETAGRFAENLTMARELVRRAEDTHKREKAPYWHGGRAVDNWKAAFIKPIADAMAPLSRILLDFATRKEMKARETVGLWDQPAKTAELSRVRGDYGSVASITVVWTYEVIDIGEVRPELLTVNDAKIKEIMKRRDPVTGRPLANEPGIAWVAERRLGVR
jgi:hypothetical protein